jgi:7,8-dihydro-6-hydroxymethylpterin-pyrophosphokinase
MRQRRFVLEPLAEVAPKVVDPATGKTAGELLAELPAGDGSVRRSNPNH